MNVSLVNLDGRLDDLLVGSRLMSRAIDWSRHPRPRFYSTTAIIPDYDSAVELPRGLLPETPDYDWGPSQVAVFSLSDRRIETWLAFWKGTQKMEPFQIHRHEIGGKLLRDTFDEIHDRFGLAEGARRFGFCVNYPGMLTTTVNQAKGELCGLHFDSWESRTLRERRNARKRICVNLGPGPRWFLFVPFTLDALLASPDIDLDQDPTGIVTESFVSDPTRLQCVALRLVPGQAYIAPTECVMHDASSVWSDMVNYSAQFMVSAQAIT